MPYPIPKNLKINVEKKAFLPRHEMAVPEVYTEFYGISFILEGDRKLITPNMISILRAGDVGFTTMHMHHRATYLTHSPYSRYLIKFTPALVGHLLEKLKLRSLDELLPYPVYHFPPDSQQKIQQIFADMLDEFTHYDEYSETILEGRLYELLLTVKREHVTDNLSDMMIHNVSEEVLEALSFIDANISRHININETAAHAGFSPSHFSRIFKENMGVTYSAYLLSARLQRAMVLLTKTTQTLEEIAAACGFPDASYLCHVFKRKYYQSPSAFRKTAAVHIERER